MRPILGILLAAVIGAPATGRATPIDFDLDLDLVPIPIATPLPGPENAARASQNLLVAGMPRPGRIRETDLEFVRVDTPIAGRRTLRDEIPVRRRLSFADEFGTTYRHDIAAFVNSTVEVRSSSPLVGSQSAVRIEKGGNLFFPTRDIVASSTTSLTYAISATERDDERASAIDVDLLPLSVIVEADLFASAEQTDEFAHGSARAQVYASSAPITTDDVAWLQFEDDLTTTLFLESVSTDNRGPAEHSLPQAARRTVTDGAIRPGEIGPGRLSRPAPRQRSPPATPSAGTRPRGPPRFRRATGGRASSAPGGRRGDRSGRPTTSRSPDSRASSRRDRAAPPRGRTSRP